MQSSADNDSANFCKGHDFGRGADFPVTYLSLRIGECRSKKTPKGNGDISHQRAGRYLKSIYDLEKTSDGMRPYFTKGY